jgi:regulatory protein
MKTTETSKDNSDGLSATRDCALRILTRREHSIFELKQKLRGRGFEESAIEQVVQEMLSQNYLNEERFVEAWIYHRQQRGFGPNRIRMELQTQQISETLIEAYLDEHNDDWSIKASELRSKHFGEYPTDYPTRAKQQRYLYQKGFTNAQINAAMQQD